MALAVAPGATFPPGAGSAFEVLATRAAAAACAGHAHAFIHLARMRRGRKRFLSAT